MKRIIIPEFFAILLSACGGDDSSKEENPTTCLGFTSPQLMVSVLGSISQAPIETAIVSFTYSSGSMTLSYNVMEQAYEGLLADTNDITEGTIIVTSDGYNSAVIRNLNYSFSESCESPGNIKEEIIYLCPKNTACI